MVFLIIALHVVAVVVVAIIGNVLAIFCVNVTTIRMSFRNNEGVHVSILRLLMVFLFIVLLFEIFPQVFLVEVLMRGMRRLDDLIDRLL